MGVTGFRSKLPRLLLAFLLQNLLVDFVQVFRINILIAIVKGGWPFGQEGFLIERMWLQHLADCTSQRALATRSSTVLAALGLSCSDIFQLTRFDLFGYWVVGSEVSAMEK